MSNIRFYNFWHNFRKDRFYFYQLIQYLQLDKNIDFYSVFGNYALRFFLPSKRKKIFFTGENINTFSAIERRHKRFANYNLNYVDLAIGMEYIENFKYLRIPLWFINNIKPQWELEDIQMWITMIEEKNKFNNFFERTQLMSLIASHDRTGIRSVIADVFSNKIDIKYAGSFRNNDTSLKAQYENDKISYLKNFIFNICPENSNTMGYVTEKIFDSFLAGCIPIYTGSFNIVEPDILNSERIIFVNKENPSEVLKNNIDLFNRNPIAIKKHYSTPVFKENAAKELYNKQLKIREAFINL
jgi:hypothetical protein